MCHVRGLVRDNIGLHSTTKYYDSKLVREVKLVYNPDEYRTGKQARPLHTIKGLIKILENDKNKRNEYKKDIS